MAFCPTCLVLQLQEGVSPDAALYLLAEQS
jgi:hypothetical protein